MLCSFSFLVLLLVTTLISSGSTFVVGNDFKKRASFLGSEAKSKDDVVNESKKPVIIGLKRASGDVEGLSKILSQLSEIKNPELNNYNEKNDENSRHISPTELENSEFIFYPLKNIYLKGLEEPLNLNSIAIKVYNPSIREKIDDLNVKDVPTNNMNLEIKSNEIMKTNSSNFKKRNRSSLKRNRASLTMLDMLSSTEISNSLQNNLYSLSNEENPTAMKQLNTFDNKVKNFIFEKSWKYDSSTCEMCTNFSNENSEMMVSYLSSTSLSSTNVATDSDINEESYSNSPSPPPYTATTLQQKTPETQKNLRTPQNYTFRENIDSKNPVNLQITLTLRINNGSMNILPP